MEIIPGVERNASSTTTFIANFFKEEIGEEKLNLLTQNNLNYIEMIKVLTETRKKDSTKIASMPQDNSEDIKHQTNMILKKIELECQRIREYTNVEFQKSSLEKITGELEMLERNVLEGQGKLITGSEINNIDPLQAKAIELETKFIEGFQKIEKEDFRTINQVIYGRDDIKERLAKLVDETVKNDFGKDITTKFAISIAQKELVTMLTMLKASEKFVEELTNGNFNLEEHQKFLKTSEAKERYIEAAHGILYYYLEVDRIIESSDLMKEATICLEDDFEVVEEGYHLILNGFDMKLEEEQLRTFNQKKEAKKREVQAYNQKPKPADLNHPNPFMWRFTTIMALTEFDKLMQENNIQVQAAKGRSL